MQSKVDLSKFDNSWYKPGNPLKRLLWYYMNLLVLRNRWIPLSSLKRFVLKMFGAKIGKGVIIKPGVHIKYPWNLEIGDHCWIGENVWIDNLAQVTLDNNVCLSQGAFLETGNHNYKKTTFDLMIEPIHLEDGVWIGAGSILVGGVICRSHSVLTAGSVLTSQMEPYFIYAGNPATQKKRREVA